MLVAGMKKFAEQVQQLWRRATRFELFFDHGVRDGRRRQAESFADLFLQETEREREELFAVALACKPGKLPETAAHGAADLMSPNKMRVSCQMFTAFSPSVSAEPQDQRRCMDSHEPRPEYQRRPNHAANAKPGFQMHYVTTRLGLIGTVSGSRERLA